MPGPYSTLADSTEIVTNYLLQQLTSAASTFTDPTGAISIQDVWYGDQTLQQTAMLPRMPCMCVIPGPEDSQYEGVGGRPVRMTFQTYVMVYYGIVQDIQLNTHASLTIANKVKRFVNADINLGGNVIDCMCRNVTPGVAIRGAAMVDATRLTFVSRSKVTLNA